MQDSLKVSATLEMEHRVKVIRHHAPSVQVVPFTIEVLKRTRDDRGMRTIAKNAAAVAFIEIRIQFQTEKTIDLCAF
ncbi:MAG TPA: hypothetical protein VGQ65_01185 [Thermoanaerobaculia bacterium]|nr:hypothetical protein [Thermoanaerobaculia bacterium]